MISLETLQRKRASSRNDGGPSWFFSSGSRNLELPKGTQGASSGAPGKSNLYLSCEGELWIDFELL